MSPPGPRTEPCADRGSADPPPTPPVALVTGAARRIGRASALALADAGWDIGVHYQGSRDEAEQTAAEIRARGRRAVCLGADLAGEAEATGLVARLAQELGPVGLLVNNASRFRRDDIDDFRYAGLIEHLLPNLAAPLLLARELARSLPVGSQGVVVNLLDQKLFNPNPDFLSYTLSKAGLHSATVMLAQALAPRLRVVGVAPGLTLPSYLQDEAEFAAAHRRYSPLGRSSTAADVAAAIVFAASNPALTGSVITVDGGQHLMPLARDVSLLPREA